MAEWRPYVTLCGHVVDRDQPVPEAAVPTNGGNEEMQKAKERHKETEEDQIPGFQLQQVREDVQHIPADRSPRGIGGVNGGTVGTTTAGYGWQTRDTPSLHECVPPGEMDALLDTLQEGILLLDVTLQVVAVNDAVVSDTGIAEVGLVGTSLRDLIEVEDFDTIRRFAARPDAGESRLTVHEGALRTATGDRRRAEFQFVGRQQTAGPTGVVLTYRLVGEETDRQRRARQQERLGLVNQFNSTLRSVARSILNPTSRAHLEDVVCRELAAAAPYEFAVIVERRPTADGPEARPRTWAGIEDADLETLLDPLESDQGRECPINTAIAEETVQVATDIHRDPMVADCLAAVAMDVASVAVVPIQYEDTNYGVLAVYAAREGPFDDYEVRMLEELGEIVGFAYNAVDKDALLATDSVVELEFEVTDRSSFFVAASAAADCSLTLESVVPTADDHLLYYNRVTDGDPDRLLELAADAPSVARAEVIREHDDVCWMVFRLADRSLVERLTRNNVNVREVEAHSGVARLVCEVSPTVGVDSVIELLDATYSEFELVAKRQRERPAFTTPEFRHEVLETLTHKQRKTLEAAYQSGYFNRPRGSTAEEIAGQLDISSSTFHQHLRAAMSKLMAILLESENGQSAIAHR